MWIYKKEMSVIGCFGVAVEEDELLTLSLLMYYYLV